jgi:purine-binding chemotaxis protein CheW
MTDTLELSRGTGTEGGLLPDGAQLQFVSFLVGDRAFGVDIIQVREITQWAQTTPLPNQPPYTRGVLNLRGTIIPVHDLRKRFGGPETEASETSVIVIVQISEQTIGLLVDAVSDILTIQPEQMLPVPSGGQDIDARSLSGLVNTEGGMVAVLNLEMLFADLTEVQ